MSYINQMMPGQQSFGMPNLGGLQRQNPMMAMMMQMMQTMMQMMMQMGGQMGGGDMGGGFSPYQNPGFGGGCGCGGGGGGFSPMNNFMGGGGGYNNGFNGGGGNYNSGYGGGGGGRGYGAGQNDSYVPGGTSALGGPPNINGAGQGANAVRWALSKEGISERNNPGAVRAFSRGRWQPWCADFVSQALAASGGSAMGHQSSVQGILNWGRQNNRFMPAGAAQANPGSLRPGDVVVWKSGGKSHVGLFTGMNRDGTFNTIEGNTGDAVRRRTHTFGRGLTGFVRAARN